MDTPRAETIRRIDIETVRGEFPGAEKWLYFDVGGRGLLPLRSRRALDSYLDMRTYDGGDKPAMFATVESARRRFAAMIGAETDEIAITKNVSEGLNIIAASYPWKAGDVVVVCAEREHPNNVYIWLHLARRFGIEVRLGRGGSVRMRAGVCAEGHCHTTARCA